MTSIAGIAERLYRKIKWQEVPEQMGYEDMVAYVCDAIRKLYVISGRTFLFSENKFVLDESGSMAFEDDMEIDELEWILLECQIEFYKACQSNVDDMKGYTTDAMSVTHSDKPYANFGETISRLKEEQNRIWYGMVRFNQLGVSD